MWHLVRGARCTVHGAANNFVTTFIQLRGVVGRSLSSGGLAALKCRAAGASLRWQSVLRAPSDRSAECSGSDVPMRSCVCDL
jgi:hypothetical protein